MGFISDDDRRAQRQYAVYKTAEEARIQKEAREKLLEAFREIGTSLVASARKNYIASDGRVEYASSSEVKICHPHDDAALNIYEEDPILLIAAIDHALDMSHGQDYQWSSPPYLETQMECCGWDSGLRIHVSIKFTPPIT